MDPIEGKNSDHENSDFRPWGLEVNQFCMFMHLSQLAGYVLPIAGWVLPVIMWATNKDQSEMVDQQGKNILNWMISSLIYIAISTVLIFVFIGIPMLFIVGICTIVFSILGALKASDGLVYRYPLAINFLNRPEPIN